MAAETERKRGYTNDDIESRGHWMVENERLKNMQTDLATFTLHSWFGDVHM